MMFERFFPGGLNHVRSDAPHNDAARILIECDPCLAYAQQVARELQHER